MPKVKPEYRLTDEETPAAPDINELVARELAERSVTGDETLYPDQNVAIPPLSPAPQPAPSIEPDMEEAKRRIDAIFAKALVPVEPTLETLPVPPAPVATVLHVHPELGVVDGPPFAGGDDATSRLRKEVLAELVADDWKHADAVTVANRVKEMLDADEDLNVGVAKEEAVYEFEESRPKKAVKASPFVADDEPEPLSEVPSGVGISGTVCGVNWKDDNEAELAQILHNFERDITRLRKLLGMEGVKRKSKKESHG